MGHMMRQYEVKVFRVCQSCGKPHDTGLENTQTQKVDPCEKCYDCVMNEGWTFKPVKEQVMLQMEKDYEEAYKELSDIPKYWIPIIEVEEINEPK